MVFFRKTYQTKTEHTAISIGSGDLPVLATPSLVAFMENAAFTYLAPHLDQTKSSVGIEVTIQHLAASQVGQDITILITAVQHERHYYHFELEAYAGDTLVGRGKHRRAIVIIERFLGK